jgi:predicted nucleic acid-binding protein
LFAGRILPFDSAAAELFAEIVAERRRIGRPIEAFDAQIAAIAHSTGMALATRNVDDFDGVGVAVFDPWRM